MKNVLRLGEEMSGLKQTCHFKGLQNLFAVNVRFKKKTKKQTTFHILFAVGKSGRGGGFFFESCILLADQ